jgi:hypothetical protein
MPVARRELVLDHGRVFIEVPRLMTDDEIFDDQVGSGLSADVVRTGGHPSRENEPPCAANTARGPVLTPGGRSLPGKW